MRKIRLMFVCLLAASASSTFAQSLPMYLDISRAQVKLDRTKEFEDNVKKIVDVNRRMKGDRWIALSTEYGNAGTYQFASSRENLAAVESGMEAFMRAIKEGMGPLGDKLLRDVMGASNTFRSELRRRRWDLSVHPPSDPAAMNDLLAHTRWIRTIRIDVKPGKGMEFIDAWKQWQQELDGVAPPLTVVVSEASTGTPAMHVAMYEKSMAQMDAENAAVQKAVASPAYANLMKMSGDAVAMTNWEIHRLRPELSNPPDEVVNADPGFWKTQAETAAAGPKKKSGK
jgi:hypothetical protein